MKRMQQVAISLLFPPLALIALLAAACTTLRPVEPDDLIGADAPDRVQVTEQDRTVVVFHQPRVVGDTLIGTVNGVSQRLLLWQGAAIQVREPAPERTANLVVGGGVAAIVLIAIVAPKLSAKALGCTCGAPYPGRN